MTKQTQQMPLLMIVGNIELLIDKAIAIKGELESEVSSKTFTKS